MQDITVWWLLLLPAPARHINHISLELSPSSSVDAGSIVHKVGCFSSQGTDVMAHSCRWAAHVLAWLASTVTVTSGSELPLMSGPSLLPSWRPTEAFFCIKEFWQLFRVDSLLVNFTFRAGLT